MQQIKTDICVIGGGSGGLSVAAGAVQMGARVVLIEGGRMGGDCLNYGCVPSKALIAAGKQAHAMTAGKSLGVAPAEPRVDYAAVNDHIRRAIDTIAPHDSQERFESLGCTVIRDWAHFVSPDEVEAGGKRIRARRFVIATGSSPFVPPIQGLDGVDYLTNETLFDLREKPGHLIVIGGGPIGMEMAQAHRRLGCQVTVLEGEKALGKDDPELAAIVIEQLKAEGIEIVEGDPAAQVHGSAGAISVVTQSGAEFTGTHLLIAVGRKVNIDRLHLEAAKVDHGRAITVGDDLRSVSNRRVYAVGDAAGGLQFTHVAGYHAGVIARSMLFGLPARAKSAHIPWATYTDPEMAHVGSTEAEARKTHGDRLSVVRFDFAGSDRAIAEAKTDGRIKVMIVKGRPVGASIVGPQAGELISVWALALANGLKMSAIANTVLPYPTLSEVSKRAASSYFSPKLFGNVWVKRVVGQVQRWLP